MLFVVFPCLLATGLIGWAGLRGLEEQVNARMQDDLELIARTLRLPLSQAIARNRPELIRDTIESTVGFGRVYAVNVYDESGHKIAGTGRRVAAVPTAEAAELAGQPERQEGSTELGDEKLFSVFQPLVGEGERISGLLQVTRHSGVVQDYLDRVRFMALLGIGATGLLFSGVIVFGHHFSVGRHLRRLQAGMRRIREGDLSHRLEIGGAAEFRHVAHGINRMLDGITESQRQLEAQRATEQSLRARLQRSEKMAAIGRLAAGIAHELGSPLSTLSGRTQQMLRNAPEGSDERKALLAISDAADDMEKTIRQLMDFGRCNPVNRAPVRVAALLRELADDARERGPQHMRIEVDMPPETLQVQADALRLEQAVRNLLENAVHAARSRVRVGATIATDEPHATGLRNPMLQIFVGDDGPGVPDAEHERVFEPFYTSKPVGQGTGLGLSVASAVADDHDGSLAVSRDPLGGARFTLTLPLNTSTLPLEAPDVTA